MAEGMIKTKFGEYREILFYDGKSETIALVMGEVSAKTDVLCRVHSSCLYGHAFNSIECDCREQMDLSQQMIEKAGCGVIIWLEHEGKGNGHFALMKSKDFKNRGMKQGDAYEAAGFSRDARDFTPAAEILKILSVESIIMLTDNPGKVSTLTAHGVKVSAVRAVDNTLSSEI